MKNDKINEKTQKFTLLESVYDWMRLVVWCLVAVIAVNIFAIRVEGVDGVSMVPTLNDGERLIATCWFTPKQGDVVGITWPGHPEKPLIKRVIATEGQTVDIDFEKGIVYVDGKIMEEPYINALTTRSFDMQFPQTVPAGHVFVMGDNRNESHDSRSLDIGMIDERYIFAKTLFRILPLNKIGAVK